MIVGEADQRHAQHGQTTRQTDIADSAWCCLQLMTSQFIDAERLLKVIPHARLLEIQALLQKHLGDHKEALRLVSQCWPCASTLLNVSGCHALRRSGLLIKCFA